MRLPWVLLVVFAAAGATSVQDQLAPCPVYGREGCRCSADLRDFYCRTAGFTHVPQDLPYSVTKL